MVQFTPFDGVFVFYPPSPQKTLFLWCYKVLLEQVLFYTLYTEMGSCHFMFIEKTKAVYRYGQSLFVWLVCVNYKQSKEGVNEMGRKEEGKRVGIRIGTWELGEL